MFILWIIIIGIIVYAFKDKIHIDSKKPDHSDALETLNKKYVSGMIDEETYIRMKKVISE